MEDFITHRVPAEEDGDEDGDVFMCRSPQSTDITYIHWSYVKSGVPWRHSCHWKPPAKLPGLKGQWIKASDFMPTRKYAEGKAEGKAEVQVLDVEFPSWVELRNIGDVKQDDIWRPFLDKDDRPLFDN